MSTWTHVNGSIRFDSIRFSAMNDKLKPELGNKVSFDDDEAAWDACDIPCGSGGSLDYSIIENKDISSMAAYVVTIWGDLRDYDNLEEIKKYLEKITKDRMIRSGVVEINIESKTDTILCYDKGKREWVPLLSTKN